MAAYIVTDSQGLIANRIEWDGISSYSCGEGFTLVEDTQNMHIGGTYINGVYTAPYTPPVVLIP